MHRLLILIYATVFMTSSCSRGTVKELNMTGEQKTIINTNPEGQGPEISIELYKGKSFYYPLMAAWIEDESGDYIQTLYVPVSVATGVFKYGKKENNKWVPGPKRAPQTLPYWSHKRGVIASDGLFIPGPENPVPDTYTGATPLKSFILNTRADKPLPVVYRILFEINQNWDWNEYWTNNKFPDDENYKMSCQPALVYEALIDTRKSVKSCTMKPIGHSHYSGKTGELFPDLKTLTTALHIADSIVVIVK
jgi:hypothetical protein